MMPRNLAAVDLGQHNKLLELVKDYVLGLGFGTQLYSGVLKVKIATWHVTAKI